mgnify:CR=1 FL=1
MCDTCGCNVTEGNRHLVEGDGKLARTESGREAVSVLTGLLTENDRLAAHNREHFDCHQVLAVNLMSSPGSGKTRLLEETVAALDGALRVAVIEGDLETENDAERIRAKGVPAIQISTGSACHLDAHMVHDALHDLDLDDVDVLFIENVGNLVCPASFDLGHHANVTLLSVTEGDDKPAKYPVMFRAADLVLISKHILNVERLDSPYKMIAADVNNSQTITTLDLIQLRKLILGKIDKLPESSSWRFFDKMSNQEQYAIDAMEAPMQINWMGVALTAASAASTGSSARSRTWWSGPRRRSPGCWRMTTTSSARC